MMQNLSEYITESRTFVLDYDTTFDSMLDFLKRNGYIERDIDADGPYADFKIDEMQYSFGSRDKYFNTILFKDNANNRCKMGFDTNRPNKLKLMTVTIMSKTVDTYKFDDAVRAVCTYMFPGKMTPGKNI